MRRLASLFAAVLLAGCFVDGTTREPGSIEPGDETFLLTVEVVSVEDPAVKLAGATVTAGDATGNRTSGVTDERGQVLLKLAAPQIVGLEVEAPGHAPAATAGIKLGQVDTAADVGAQVTAAFVCGLSLGLACPFDVTASLPGSEGRATVRMVPQPLVREVEVDVPATLSPPTQTTLVSAPVPYAADPSAAEIVQRHLVRAEAVLAWTNEPGAAGDFELGLACASSGTFAVTEAGGPQTLASLGAREVALAAELPAECGALLVEVHIKSASTNMRPVATVSLVSGPAVQQPLV